MRLILSLCLLVFTAAPLAAPLVAQEVLTDISSHRISITSSFDGTDLLIYGTLRGNGDVAIIVRGPETRTTIRRKDRIAGLWINNSHITYDNVPGFYALATSAPLDDIASPRLLRRLGIGLDNLNLQITEANNPQARQQDYIDALLRDGVRNGLYQERIGKISFLGDELFRTTIAFPSTVPTGNYTVQVLVLSAQNVISAQTTPLFITKTGMEQQIYDLAINSPWLHGFIAVILALIAGFMADYMLRRG